MTETPNYMSAITAKNQLKPILYSHTIHQKNKDFIREKPSLIK